MNRRQFLKIAGLGVVAAVGVGLPLAYRKKDSHPLAYIELWREEHRLAVEAGDWIQVDQHGRVFHDGDHIATMRIEVRDGKTGISIQETIYLDKPESENLP